MLNTPLTKLRKAAPGSLRVSDLLKHFRRERVATTYWSLSSFERGATVHPSDRFIRTWAAGVGATLAQVRAAHAKALRDFGRPRAAEKARKASHARTHKKMLTRRSPADNTPKRAARVKAARKGAAHGSHLAPLHRRADRDRDERGPEGCARDRHTGTAA